VAKTRSNNLQVKLSTPVLDLPDAWASRNNWMTNTLKNGRTDVRPHTSFAISAVIKGVDLLTYTEQQRIMLNGARFLLDEEVRTGVNGQQRVRLLRSESIRPAGASRA
jgi:hypothetical protein